MNATELANNLAHIATALDKAVAHGDLGAINNAVAELGRLRMALEEWDASLDADHEPFWSSFLGGKPIKVRGRRAVVLALLEMLSDEAIPDEFRYNGQTWAERAEGWVIRAEKQLEDELEDYKDCGGDPEDDDEEGNDDDDE